MEKNIAIILTDNICDCTDDQILFWYPRSYRCLQLAHYLSREENFFVTVFVPYFDSERKTHVYNNHSYETILYNGKAAIWNWSLELESKLKKFTHVIMPISQGVGFLNIGSLTKTNVIIDGAYSFLPELPGALLGTPVKFRKTYWDRYLYYYQLMLQNVNCLLYGHDRQYYYYEGQLTAISKLDWSAFQFSPLLKIPPLFQKTKTIKTEYAQTPTKILWLGSIQPQSYPELLIEYAKSHPQITIDFVGILHPLYKKSYKNYFKKYFSNLPNNITVYDNLPEDVTNFYTNYDVGILISRGWIEERYAIRNELWDMLIHGLPIIVNKESSLLLEFSNVTDSIYTVQLNNFNNDMDTILNNAPLIVSDTVRKRIDANILSVTDISELIDYINRF